MVNGSQPHQGTPWNELICNFPASHVLQTSQWAEFKSQYGWTPTYLVWNKDQSGWQLESSHQPILPAKSPAAAALVLEREALPGLRVIYLPKGPVLQDWSDLSLSATVLDDLVAYARERGALQIKLDPDLVVGWGVPGQDHYQRSETGEGIQELLRQTGWVFSREQVQFKNTVLVGLEEDEDQILARMKSKTRYNIRLSGRKGIEIRYGNVSDLPALYRLYADTSRRAGFTIRGESYYLTLWDLFLPSGKETGQDPTAQPIIAEFEGQLVAGAVIFKFGDRAWYLHGMSSPDHNEKMAPHLVQWEAMRWAKQQGCSMYDMWGAPDVFDESDSLWGVYRFKRGFGGQVTLTVGAWDYPIKPVYYALYSRWLPKILDVTRWIAKIRTNRIAKAAE